MMAVEGDNGRLLSGRRQKEEEEKDGCAGDDERP